MWLYIYMKSTQKIYLLCFNPHCPKPNQRGLSSASIHTHPQECMHHLYPTDTIVQKDWHDIENYPNDAIGKAVKNKLAKCEHRSYITLLIKSLKKQILDIIQELQNSLLISYPSCQLFDQYEDIYRLDRISYILQKEPGQINTLYKYINAKFLPTRYKALSLLNQCYDDVQAQMQQIIAKFRQKTTSLTIKHSKKKRSEIPLEEVKQIKYGLIKSKYIGSSKIQCIQGKVIFPKLSNNASFLPWVYSETSFKEGIHQFKITSARYPYSQNAGLMILQEQDKDVYPYMRYKSIFNRQGKNFQLVQGQHLDQFTNQTSIIKLRLQLDSQTPRGIIYDSERRCKYVCSLQPSHSYRIGAYGTGWSIIVIQLY